MPGYAGQHPWPDFLLVMEGENKIRPACFYKRPMGTATSFFRPASTEQGGKKHPGFN